MSFWPFPKIILDELRAGLDHGEGIEVGSGEGRLGRRLADCGIPLHALDLGSAATLRADARALPFVEGSAGLIVAGNLLRHLSGFERVEFLKQSQFALADEGRLLLLEDDPEGRTPAERNYRRALEYLSMADSTRGVAFDLDLVLGARPSGLSMVEVDLLAENEEIIDDDAAPLRWLAARGFATRNGFRELEAAVAREGMSYGRYRACVLRCTRATDGSSR